MLIGRSQELAQLQLRLERGGTVALLGEAGVGKTALLREAAERSGRRVYEGGGLATLSWLPYFPVERALGRKIPSADADWVAGEIERRVADGVLLLDDLHWIDRETRALLPQLTGRIAMLTAIRRGDPGSESAIGELTALGVDLINVEPLREADAAALVSELRPDLPRLAVTDLVRRAGRNPLLLEELAATGTPTESLQLALSARLNHLTPAARDAFSLLALAGRPLPDVELATLRLELQDAGLVVAQDGLVSVRHALLAETAVNELDEAQRQRLHARLARLVDDPGEAARHHLRAGERELALEMAQEAARRTEFAGERARHLALAAQCADGPEADTLRLEAATALVEANDFEDIESLLAAVDTADPVRRAEVRFLEYAMYDVAVEFARAKAAWKAGMDAAAGSGSDIELRLLIEEARIAYLMDADDARALELGERGLRLALAAGGRHETLARFILGSARMFSQLPGWDRDLERAVHAARAAGDVSIEYRAANNLVFGLMIEGRLQQARRHAEGMVAEARRRRLAGWERRMQGWLMGINWHGGELRNAVDDGLLLVSEMTKPNDRRVVQFYAAHALMDLGRDRDASALIDRLVAESAVKSDLQGGDAEECVEAMWAWADAQLISGNPRRALEIADECFSRFGGSGGGGEDGLTFLAVTRAWAQLESGVTVDPSTTVAERPITAGAPYEIAGVADLASGRFAEAAEHFAIASRLWHDRHFRGWLRCLWAEGEALRKYGDTESAIERLMAAEAIALQHESMPLLRRIQRSLRLSGVRRSAPRSRTASQLTGREREVLTLVGDGLTNHEIALRLGVTRPTVARLLQSASNKLGAETRAQAASLAAWN